jgi:pyruvate/2-oxoglutarate/acetoin dehydrogenase E1 component
LIVEEDNLTGGWGAEVAAKLGEVAFDELDAPIARGGARTRRCLARRRWSARTSRAWSASSPRFSA